MTNELVIHELKCWPEYFGPIIDGRKTFEVRKNDRGFKSGHTLHLREWRPQPEGGGYYTGRETHVRVLGVYSDIPAVREGYVVMSLGNGVRDSHEPLEHRGPVRSVGNEFFIDYAPGYCWVQRQSQQVATEPPMQPYEEVILSLARRIAGSKPA